MSVCLSAACLYISLYTCPFARLSVRPSHVGIMPTPLNISAIFTARRICIARTMPWQHVCPTARPTVRPTCLTLRPSVIRQASRPTHMYYCLLFRICIPLHLPIHHIHTHNVFHICLCFCVHMSVYYVHSCVRVSVCHIHVYYTSLSYISTTVCRSTCLCVCLFSCKYMRCTVVCPSICYIRALSYQYMTVCLAVHSSKFRQCL